MLPDCGGGRNGQAVLRRADSQFAVFRADAAPRTVGDDGQPLDHPPIQAAGAAPTSFRSQRRGSSRSDPARKRRRALTLRAEPAAAGPDYSVARIVDEIRQHLATWRAIPNPADWGVTPSTARLLAHWRTYAFDGVRPFFCQIEAVETIIWLTEVARGRTAVRPHLDQHLQAANAEANPDLFRLAMKMATGTGKTTVMAMLIAWQTVNAVRSPNSSALLPGLPDRHARHHDPRPAARAAAERSGQLLRDPRARAAGHAGRGGQGARSSSPTTTPSGRRRQMETQQDRRRRPVRLAQRDR